MVFGEKLKEARQNKGWTMEELGDKIGVKKQTVHGWEHGRSFPKENIIHKIADALDVSYNFLMGEDDLKEITDEYLTAQYIKKYAQEGKLTNTIIDDDTWEILKRLIEIDVINVRKKLKEDTK